MTAELRCSTCGRSAQVGFRYCPYCQAALAPESAGRDARPTAKAAEHSGHRDLTGVGLGLIALGLLGFAGTVAAFLAGAWQNSDGLLVVGGGAALLVMAGSTTLGMARGGRSGAAMGLAGGCASMAMMLAIGALFILAMVVYAIASCFRDLGVK